MAVVLSSLVSSARAQTTEEELRRLVEQVSALKDKLDSMERSGTMNERVTQIGGTRARVEEEPQMIVRIYDLGDLFSLAPPYEARHASDISPNGQLLFPRGPMGPGGQTLSGMGGMGMGGMGGVGMGAWNVEDPVPGKAPAARPASKDVLYQLYETPEGRMAAVRSSIEDLMDAITNTISTDEWQEVGGPATMTNLGTSLLVSASESTHEQIDALLNLFRKRWGTLRTVSVRAYWMWLTEDQLRALVGDEPGPPAGPKEIRAFGLVDQAAWKELLGRRPDEGAERAGYRSVITCYNGQTVYTIAGRQTLAVTNLEPTWSPRPEADDKNPPLENYYVGTSLVQEGAALQVTPIVNVSGEVVTLDVHSRVVERRDQPSQQAAAPGDAERAPVRGIVDVLVRPELMVHRLSTTLRVPVDRTMLVGGMTYQSVPKPGEPNLYLFVRTSVQELRDDTPTTGLNPVAEPKAEAPKAKKKAG